MKKHIKLLLIVVLVLLLAGGIYLLFKDDHKRMRAASSSHGPAMEFSNIELSEKDKKGNPLWLVKAKHVEMSQDKNHVHMEGITAYFYKDDNEMNLVADKGEVDRQKQTVYVEGHVEGHSKDGMVLHAENLSYDGKTEILSTDKFFTAEKDNRVLTADSFTGDRVLQELTAKGHAKLADKEESK